MLKNIVTILKLLKRYKLDLLSFNKINRLRWHFPKSYISSRICLHYEKGQQIQIGEHTTINDFVTITVTNDTHCNLNNSKLIIGSHTYIGEYNNIRAGGGTIKIGNYCSISQHITIIASNHEIAKNKLITEQPWSIKNSSFGVQKSIN